MAIQEARDQASRILASAEQQAQAILTEAEERGRRTLEETIAECKAELGRLEANRSQAQQDVDTLQRWLDEHKDHLRAMLSEALSAVDRAGVLWPAPSTRSLDSGTRPLEGGARRPAPPAPVPSAFDPQNGLGGDSGPDTMMWSPSDEPEPEVEASPAPPAAAAPRPAAGPPPAPAPERSEPLDPDQQALDDFFDEPGTEYDEEPRFGGRLRRRR
jgi:vacuolar-type H+-ATPase subunit H